MNRFPVRSSASSRVRRAQAEGRRTLANELPPENQHALEALQADRSALAILDDPSRRITCREGVETRLLDWIEDGFPLIAIIEAPPR